MVYPIVYPCHMVVENSGLVLVAVQGAPRKLDNFGPLYFDDGKQSGACGQHGRNGVFQAPILVKFGNRSGFKVEGQELRQFLDAERAGGYRDTLKKAVGKFPIHFADPLQGTLIRFVERFWQFCQSVADTPRKAAAKIGDLAVHPPEPTIQVCVSVVKK
jgi:hypothetical protein